MRSRTLTVGTTTLALLVVLAAVLLSSLPGCMGATANQLRKRAAFDLDCSAAQVEVVEIDKRTRGVRGCGRKATYVEHCRACQNGYPACDCTWVLNADARPRAANAPPKQPKR